MDVQVKTRAKGSPYGPVENGKIFLRGTLTPVIHQVKVDEHVRRDFLTCDLSSDIDWTVRFDTAPMVSWSKNNVLSHELFCLPLFVAGMPFSFDLTGLVLVQLVNASCEGKSPQFSRIGIFRMHEIGDARRLGVEADEVPYRRGEPGVSASSSRYRITDLGESTWQTVEIV